MWGMTYSPDGKSLYVEVTNASSLTGPAYPVILTFDTNTFSLVGAAPALQYTFLPNTIQATPFTADETGLVYG